MPRNTEGADERSENRSKDWQDRDSQRGKGRGLRYLQPIIDKMRTETHIYAAGARGPHGKGKCIAIFFYTAGRRVFGECQKASLHLEAPAHPLSVLIILG